MEQQAKGKFRIPPYLQQGRGRSFTTIVLTLIALSFFGFFAINPTLSTIVQLRKQLSDEQFVDAQLSQKITNLSILQQKYKSLAQDVPVVTSAIPQSPDVTGLLAQIQSLTQAHNLTVSGLQAFSVELTQKPEDPKSYSSFAFGLSAAGSYQDLLALTSSLLQFNRIVTIDNLSIDQRSANVAELTIRGRAYFKR